MSRTYPKPAGGAPNFPALEAEVLDYWDTDDTFRASIARRDGAPEYVFYDGPPFANGLPHYGHLLTGYVKDIVPRYRTMRGYQVDRRFGWDTHGLPAELEVQRQLGITDKAQIEEMGIGKFNDACRDSVLKYTDEWRAYVTRQARWVDFDNDYKTLDLDVHGVGDLGVQTVVGQGPGLRGLPRAAVLLERRDAAVQPRTADGRRRLPEPPGPGDHGGIPDRPERRRSRARTCWSGRRPRGRCRPTRPWPSTPMSTTSVVAGPDGRRYVLAQARLAAYARELGEEPEVAGHLRRAATCSACATCRRSRISWTRPTLFRCCPATSSPPRTAPASCTWRRPTARTTWRPHRPPASSPSRRSTPRAGSTRPCRTTRASTSSTPTRRSSAT